jgi:hypothetical protein
MRSRSTRAGRSLQCRFDGIGEGVVDELLDGLGIPEWIDAELADRVANLELHVQGHVHGNHPS